MASFSDQLQPHFVLFPFMAPGHLIPMVDIGRLLAGRGVIVTIITSPYNAAKVQKTVARSNESGQYPIRLLQVEFPCKQVGLPEGCENIELLSSIVDLFKLYTAANKMEESVVQLFEKLTPRPNCIVSDMCLYYTSNIATKFQIPRISLNASCCFSHLCQHNIDSSNILDSIASHSEYFPVPNMPDNDKVEFTKPQLMFSGNQFWKPIYEAVEEADRSSYGVIFNSFEELEPLYVQEYRKVRHDKAWCLGPLSLSHKDDAGKAERGNEAAINEHQYCLKWLDSQQPGSVIYACLGSISALKLPHLKELGLGLEASNKPFIWVIRENETSNDVDKWIKEDGFEERTKGRGLVIIGWAPQVLILSHPAVGGFLTHCGWNSTIEGISAGLPLITWPLFGDHFGIEKLVVQKLNIGVSLGVETPTILSAEVKVKKEDVKNAIDKLMEEGIEAIERRKRVKEFGDKAKKAVEVGGSSYLNMTMLIRDIMQCMLQQSHKKLVGT